MFAFVAVCKWISSSTNTDRQTFNSRFRPFLNMTHKHRFPCVKPSLQQLLFVAAALLGSSCRTSPLLAFTGTISLSSRCASCLSTYHNGFLPFGFVSSSLKFSSTVLKYRFVSRKLISITITLVFYRLENWNMLMVAGSQRLYTPVWLRMVRTLCSPHMNYMCLPWVILI